MILATSQNSPCWSLIRSFEVPRRVSRRVLRRESLRESLRAWLRVQVILRIVASRVVASMASSVYSSVSTLRARMLCQSSGKSVECRKPRLREDARADSPHQCCPEHRKYKCRRRQFHDDVDANHTVEVWKITNRYHGCRQGKTSRIVAMEEVRFENQGMGSKRDSVGSACWCKT